MKISDSVKFWDRAVLTSPQLKLTLLVSGQHVSESVGYKRSSGKTERICELVSPTPIWAGEPLQEIVQTTKELGLVGSFWELWGRLKCVSRGVGRRVGQHKGNEVIHAQL